MYIHHHQQCLLTRRCIHADVKEYFCQANTPLNHPGINNGNRRRKRESLEYSQCKLGNDNGLTMSATLRADDSAQSWRTYRSCSPDIWSVLHCPRSRFAQFSPSSLSFSCCCLFPVSFLSLSLRWYHQRLAALNLTPRSEYLAPESDYYRSPPDTTRHRATPPLV